MNRLSARERAREAANEYKRQQAAHAKQVAAAVAAYFRADAQATTARERLATADDARAAAIETMTALGESVATIAQLCGLDASEVRALRRHARVTTEAVTIATDESSVGSSEIRDGGDVDGDTPWPDSEWVDGQ